MSSIEQVVQKYTVDHYGDLIVPDKPKYNEHVKLWEVSLRSTYPRIIRDERSNEVLVRFLDLKGLGLIKLDDKLQVIDATSEDKCEHQLVSRIEIWKKQSEQIVVMASSDAFARIAEGEHVLHPLIVLLHRLENGEMFTITQEEIDSQPRSSKIREYLQLLEELEIVKKVNDAYTYDKTYVGILEAAKDKGLEPQTALISYVIERKYSTLKQVFGIAQLEPFVHLANSFYWPSLDVEKLVHTTRKHLMQRFTDYYGKAFLWGFDLKLSQLIKQGAILEDNGYLTGDKTRFDRMIEMKHASMKLNP